MAMNHELERYLNDHLAGASGAVLLIQHLIDTSENPDARDFFADLKLKVEADRNLLEELLSSAGLESSQALKVAGEVTARIGLLKLMWEGVEPGKLGLFEALEILALGVHGKRLLWLALKEVAEYFPEWRGFDFASLELEASRQRDGIEFWRKEAARESLPPVERRKPPLSGK